jgi:DNA-binding XRE family transcriptional regulator
MSFITLKIEHARTLHRNRAVLRLTVTEYAKIIGITRHTLLRIEKYAAASPTERIKYAMSIPSALRLAKFLSVPVEALYTEKTGAHPWRTRNPLPPVIQTAIVEAAQATVSTNTQTVV